MKKLLAVKNKVVAVVGVSSALVVGNVAMAAADDALVTAVVGEFSSLKDTAIDLALKVGPIGVGIVVAIFGVILAVSSAKKVGNVATR